MNSAAVSIVVAVPPPPPVVEWTFDRARQANETWFVQREKCASCAHSFDRECTKGSGGTRCAAVVWKDILGLPAYEAHPDLRRTKIIKRINHRGGFAKSDGFVYCIDARLPGSPCGPDAALWEPKS